MEGQQLWYIENFRIAFQKINDKETHLKDIFLEGCVLWLFDLLYLPWIGWFFPTMDKHSIFYEIENLDSMTSAIICSPLSFCSAISMA